MARLLERARALFGSAAARPAVATLLPLVAYAVFAVCWLGRGVVAHPSTQVLGNAYRDKTLLMWSFLWWPHAIAHGHDPFVANVVWAPHGVNLAWVTTSPTLAFALTPLTETLGPVFSYNVAALAAAPLAAWTTYLLARRLTHNVPASLVAGFVFGFSPYVMGQSIDHVHLAFVCLVPLAGYLAVRFFEESLGRWKYTALLALVLVLQFGISTEIFATMTVFGAVCFVLAFLLLGRRARLAELARYTALAYLAACVVVTPYLVAAFGSSTGPPVRPNADKHSLDLANTIYATATTWLRPPHSAAITDRFPSGLDEIGGYLGVPLLVAVLLALGTRRGLARRGIWLLLLAGLVAEAMATGLEVHAAGRRLMPGVWSLIRHLPAIGVAMPIRFAMYTILFVALAVALWLAQPGRRLWRFALAGVVVASLLPNPSSAFWTSHVRQSTFFQGPDVRRFIRPGDTVLLLPYASPTSWTMLWQAEAGFRFSTIAGHIGQAIIPPECKWYGYYQSLTGSAPPGGAAGFRRFVLAHGVDVILEGPGTGAWPNALVRAAFPDVRSRGAADSTVLRLPPGLPGALPRGGPQLPPALHHFRVKLRRKVCGH